jgi:cytochrome c-type biogenesis protein
MQEFLTQLYVNSAFPAWSALILGLLTAISPCPLATNITAVGYLSKDLENKKLVFFKGLTYSLGRIIGYTSLAFVLFLGADQFQVSFIFQRYGEKILGPLLIVIALFMLGVIRLNIKGIWKFSEWFRNKDRQNFLDVILLGIVFSLSFCPYSGVLYFGMLIPMTVESASGLYLPIIFALATSLPVILFAWLIAFAVSEVGSFYNRIKSFEFWFRKIVAVLFLCIGVYYVIVVWIK